MKSPRTPSNHTWPNCTPPHQPIFFLKHWSISCDISATYPCGAPVVSHLKLRRMHKCIAHETAGAYGARANESTRRDNLDNHPIACFCCCVSCLPAAPEGTDTHHIAAVERNSAVLIRSFPRISIQMSALIICRILRYRISLTSQSTAHTFCGKVRYPGEMVPR